VSTSIKAAFEKAGYRDSREEWPSDELIQVALNAMVRHADDMDATQHAIFRACRNDAARLIKDKATAAGLDTNRYSGHSLRSGLATAAGEAGLLLPNIMRQTRHKTVEAVLGYVRPSDLWRDNVTETLFK